MSRKRIELPESKLILGYLHHTPTIDYKVASLLISKHPTMARRYLKALYDAKLIHISEWKKDKLQPGPYWPVYGLGDDDDAEYPGEQIKRQRNVRRRKRERPAAIDPVYAALTGGVR
jgi:hypothetical protein